MSGEETEEARALSGLTVLVTRAAEQARALVAALSARGARVVAIPTIEIAAPSDPAPLEAAVAATGSYDWLVFTSANGAERFLDLLLARGNATLFLSIQPD